MSRPDLAKAADIPYPTIAGIENSDQASSTRLHVLAKALKVRPEWLETGKGEMEALALVPEDGWADLGDVRSTEPGAAGAVRGLRFPTESLGRKGLNPKNLALLRDQNGNDILFDTSDTEPRDDKIYVISYEGRLMAKRLVELGGRWFIESDNKDEPRRRKPVAVDEARQFAILGRVRWIGSWED